MARSVPSAEPNPRSIRAALLREDVGTFDSEYRQAMAEATETLDLNPVLALLERWRRIAWSSADPAAHQRMLRNAARLEAGENQPTESSRTPRPAVTTHAMYSVEADVEAVPEIEALPVDALGAYAELMVVLETAPWSGDLLNRERPSANMRSHTFGPDGRGLAIYTSLRTSAVSSWSASCGFHEGGFQLPHLPTERLTPTRACTA